MIIDQAVIAAYFLGMLYLGWRCRRHSTESYWVADRRQRTGRVTASLVATIFGASSTIGVIGLGYARGLTGAWWTLIGGLALIPFGLGLAARVRASNVYTLPDILRKSYGETVAVPAGLMISIAWCGVVAAQLVAGGRLLSGAFGVDFVWTLAAVAIVFTLYTYWGGQRTVMATDSWQLVLFVGGLLLCLGFVLWMPDAGGSWRDRVPVEHLLFPVAPDFGWYDVLVFYPVIVGLPYVVGPDMYSRVMCAKDAVTARRAALLAAVVVIPLSFLLAFLGLVIRGQFPDVLPEVALPHILAVLIPVGLKGLIVAGFLGALMSSADTCLISASTILTINVIGPLARISPARRLSVTRTAVIVIGLIAWLIAGLQQGIIQSLLLGYTVFVGGVVIPTLAGFYRARLNITARGALWAIIVGGSTAVLGKINQGTYAEMLLPDPLERLSQTLLGPHYLSLLPVLFSIIVIFVVSWTDRSVVIQNP